MPLFVKSHRFGEPTYAIHYQDGNEPRRAKGGQEETSVQITDDQANLGVDACALRFETGRLRNG